MKKLRGKVDYVILFVAVLLLYAIVMLAVGAYPFGENSILYEDAMDQYTGILTLCIEWIKSGCQGTFLWERGLGVDVLINMYYYGMSPFNIIAFVLGVEKIELAMAIMMVLKTSLLAPAALYFFRHTNLNKYANESASEKTSRFAGLVMALAFGLSGYVVAFNHNVIWLDCLLLLPFIAIAVERLAQGRCHLPYVLLLALSFVVNFYFSFYMAIFIVCYFLVQPQNGVKEFFKSAVRFLLMSIFSAMMAAVVLLPAFYFIAVSAKSSVSMDIVTWNQVGNIGSFINSFYVLDSPSTGYLFNHNNYCGTFVGVLLVIFFLLKKVQITTRIKFGLVTLFIVAGLNVAGLNYVLHGFVVTHGLGNRFGFIMTFLVLAMSYVALLNLKDITGKGVAVAILVPVAVFGAELALNSDKASGTSYLMAIFMMAAFAFLLVFLLRKSIKPATFYKWVLVLWAVEIFVNGYAVLSNKYVDGTLDGTLKTEEWLSNYEALEADDGERKTAMYTWNYMPYTEVAWYSSVMNGSTIDAFISLGMSHNTNVEYTYRDITPLTATLFNVRYVLSNDEGEIPGYTIINDDDQLYIYQAEKLLGMGFVADSALANWSANGTATENQNEFVWLATGGAISDHMFQEVDVEDLAISFVGGDMVSLNGDTCTFISNNDMMCRMDISFTVDEDMVLYMETTNSDLQKTMVIVNGERLSATSYVESEGILYIGDVSAGDSIEVRIFNNAEADKTCTETFRFYAYNGDVFDAFYEYARANTLDFGGYDGNKMTASITSDKDGLLYLALPYNYGYTIYVDGVEADVVKIGSGLMGVNVTAGTHDIVVKYNTPMLLPGVIISLIGIIIFVVLVIVRKKRHLEISKEKEN